MKTPFILLSILFTMNLQAQTLRNPSTLFDPAPYAFSHVSIVPPGSQLIFVAGQGGEENIEGKLSPDFRTQVRHVISNIQKALAPEGLTMNNVVKITTLIVGHDDEKLKILIEELQKVWPQKNFPVNTLIPVPKLALKGMLVEIDAVAVK